MLDTLSIPAPAGRLIQAPVLPRRRDRLHWAESAPGRTAAGLVTIVAMGIATTQLGAAGLPVSCALAALAVGLKIRAGLRRR